MSLGSKFLGDLSRAHTHRRVAEGMDMLDRATSALDGLPPSHPRAAELVLLVAQWVDVGYKSHDLLDRLLSKFSPEYRQKLTVQDYLRIRMVEAFHSFSTNNLDAAIDTLTFVLKAEQEFPDKQLIALVLFWKGRAHRKKGEYDLALQDCLASRTLSCRIDSPYLLLSKGSLPH